MKSRFGLHKGRTYSYGEEGIIWLVSSVSVAMQLDSVAYIYYGCRFLCIRAPPRETYNPSNSRNVGILSISRCNYNVAGQADIVIVS